MEEKWRNSKNGHYMSHCFHGGKMATEPVKAN
jgi:hypothetical protein